MNLEKWAHKDFWSESELQGFCCGLEPDSDRTSAMRDINEASEDIRRAVLASALPCTSPSDVTKGDKLYGHARFFKPNDAIRWAAAKFPNFPFTAPEEVTREQCSSEKGQLMKREKPLRTIERNTLLTIIAVLAKAAKVPLDDYRKPGKAAGYIEGLTDEFGAHVSKRAIEDHLKKIPDALGTRMK